MAAIATTTEVIDFLQYATYTLTVDKLPDVLGRLIKARIVSLLVKTIPSLPAFVDLPDDYDLLWASSMCFWMEYLAERGQIQTFNGDVVESKIGEVTTRMQRWSPNNFFSKGGSVDIQSIMPHDTYRVQGYEFIENWKRWYFDREFGEVRFGTSAARFDLGIQDISWLPSGSDPAAVMEGAEQLPPEESGPYY